jgi:uncharacterized protein YyaL (SSP411 family)
MTDDVNRMKNETSPYLLQHKDNPVHWYPWGKEALDKARDENKPIFLSIGYSACHWCHVMAHESFENPEIAKVMNKGFINIKVDREERPDVDSVYMKAVIALTGHGGWPISLFLTPKLNAYFGGTYYPPAAKYNRPGFMQILDEASQMHAQDDEKVLTRSKIIIKKMLQRIEIPITSSSLDWKPIDQSVVFLDERFDDLHGGFGLGMKFPEPMNYEILLRNWKRKADQRSMEMLDKSLTRMSQGGIYDQLGGGFHRYATDREWLVPHFEKMLYDNALLVKLFLDTFQATKQGMYHDVAVETLIFIQKEMTDSLGYFYASQDADTEGVEGKYYVWGIKEVLELLGPKHAKVAARAFGITSAGNFEGKNNVLTNADSMEKVSEEESIPIFEVSHILNKTKETLLNRRLERPQPGTDKKLIVAWNGLAITAFSKGYAILRKESLLDSAVKCSEFIWAEMVSDGKLLRIYKDGQSKITGFLEDYAYLIEGFLNLYEASFDMKWFVRAKELALTMIDNFWDSKEGGFFIYGELNDPLPIRPKNPQDEAVYSANAIATLCLLKIGRMAGDDTIFKKGEENLKAFQGIMEEQPASCNGLLAALDAFLCSPTEMVFVGSKEDPVFQEMYRKSQHDYIPNKILVYSEGEETDKVFPIAQGKRAENGQAAVYLCQNQTCHAPVHSGKALENQMEKPPIIQVNIFDKEKSEKEMRSQESANFLGAMGQMFKQMGIDKQ